MKNVLLDINVVLDVLLQREPWFADSSAVWQSCDDGKINGDVAAVSLTNIWHITRLSGGTERARRSVEAFLRAFHIASTYRETLEAAMVMSGVDFEDNVQIASAKTSLLDAIIMRDAEGYRSSPIPVLAPAELLSEFSDGHEPSSVDQRIVVQPFGGDRFLLRAARRLPEQLHPRQAGRVPELYL